jgi:hypothetical protein
MAMDDSVTVSMGEDTIGTLRGIFFENLEEMLHWDLDYLRSTLILFLRIEGP